MPPPFPSFAVHQFTAMTITSTLFNRIFQESIETYHVTDDIHFPCPNSYEKGTLGFLLFEKNWIDTAQWHMEDLIRVVDVDPAEAIQLKREIDVSNQLRTDRVEQLEDFFFSHFSGVKVEENARMNTETIGWAIDRLSILNLKLYHFREETEREGISPEHRQKCEQKLAILQEQYADLSQSIDDLLDEIAAGKCQMKVYRQMKMYNDAELNPMLRKN